MEENAYCFNLTFVCNLFIYRYFVCTGSPVPQRRECASGLHFNLQQGVCDRPETANCQPLVIQNTLFILTDFIIIKLFAIYTA